MDIHTRKKRKEKKSSIDSRIVIKIGPTTINLAQSKSTLKETKNVYPLCLIRILQSPSK